MRLLLLFALKVPHFNNRFDGLAFAKALVMPAVGRRTAAEAPFRQVEQPTR